MSIVIEIGPTGAHVACGSLAVAERAAALARIEHRRHTFTVRNLSRIPAQPGKPQVGHAGFRSALSEPERPDGAERPPIPNSMLPVEAAASNSSAPLSHRSDLGGADDLLDIPAFLRRTADNRVPA